MTQQSAPVTIETLLSQSDWVRRLAYSLTRDQAEADDLVQETWLVVAQHPPAHDSNLKSWTRTVMKNILRRRWRGETRRAAREHAVAESEIAGDVAELSARANMLSKVAGHVHSLDEAQRTVVLLRYFDELPPRKIAERLQIPVNTVNSRLQRAHARLRELLKDEFGDGWVAALMPLLRWPPAGGIEPPDPAATRAGRMARAAAVSAAAAALVFAVASSMSGGQTARPPGSGRPDAGAAAAASARTPAERRAATVANDAADDDAGAANAGSVANDAAARDDASFVRARGTVLATGAPAGRVTLRLTPLAAVHRDPGGEVLTFEVAAGPLDIRLPRTDGKGRRIAEWIVDAEAPDQIPCRRHVRAPLTVEGGDVALPDIVLTPAPIATGIVTWDGEPGATARVGSFSLEPLAPMKPIDLVTTTAGAEFRLRLPLGQRAVVAAVVEGCVPAAREIDVTAPGEVRSVGEFSLTRGEWIRGRVSANRAGIGPNPRIFFWSEQHSVRSLDFDDFRVSWDGATARRHGAQLQVGADGSFAAGGFGREPFKIAKYCAYGVAGDLADPVVNRPVTPPADLTELEFRGTPFDFVVTSAGIPVEKARVALRHATASAAGWVTDATGTLTMLGKPGSTYAWHVELEGYLPADGTLTLPPSGSMPATSVELVAKPKQAPATWTVRVRSVAGGVPDVVGLGFFLVSEKGVHGPLPHFVRDVNPANGEFRIADVPAGRWRLEIRPGCAWYDPCAFETAAPLTRQLGAGESAHDDVTATPAGRSVFTFPGIEGADPVSWILRVRNEAKELVPVTVSRRSALGTSASTGVPFEGVADVFPALPPGRYTVEADAIPHRGLDGFSVPFEVVAGRVTHVPVKITRR